MENTPEAAVAPEAKTETTPTTNTNPADAPAAPDMHGFTSEQLAEMRKFYDANGGFDKVKSRLSNPEPPKAPEAPAEPAQPAQPAEPAQSPSYHRPVGAITPQEFLVQEYFNSLSREEAYAPIADKISSGAVLKDMAQLGVHALNEDGTINDSQIRAYLGLAAKTVPAKQTATTPEAGAAPTVDYIKVEGDIKDMKQAMAVLQQDSLLQRAGKGGHPDAKKAEEFMRSALNPNAAKK